MLRKARVGVQLRRFREERNMTQAALARSLDISPSYVNQMESNQRPITAPVLFKLASVFDADLKQFSTDAVHRLEAQLRDVLAGSPIDEGISNAEIHELAAAMPSIGQFLVELHARYQHVAEATHSIAAQIDAGGTSNSVAIPLLTYEVVQDLFYARRNHFPSLDAAAEQLFNSAGFVIGDTGPGIANRLTQKHAIRIVTSSDTSQPAMRRSFHHDTQVLTVSSSLDPGQRAFQLAAHLAFTEFSDEIDEIVRDADLSNDETKSLARTGLANYFAAALLMPYQQILTAAEQMRYDIVLLERQFRVGFETVAQRLSSLDRPKAAGVPFFFVRVDRAGNISKRQSATDFHFSRVGGSCPLWNVYESFSYPGQTRTQLAQMPDGRTYLWVAQAISHHSGGHGAPAKTFAIGLGCDLRHAHRLVYSDGLDLTQSARRTPIGPGCKLCDRTNCPQRAFPEIGKPQSLSRNESSFIPYRRSSDIES